MKEVWKDIKGFEGLYQISNYGRVQALPTARIWRNVRHNDGRVFDELRTRRNRILKPIYPGTRTTAYVHLYTIDHQRISLSIKRLVAEAFLSDFSSSTTTASIRHKNNNLDDCRADNLYIKKGYSK